MFIRLPGKLSTKLLFTYSAAVIVCVCVVAIPLHVLLRQSYVSRTAGRFGEGLQDRAPELVDAAQAGNDELLDTICDELNAGYEGRVTIIDANGELIADSISPRCAALARPECREFIRENQRRMAAKDMPLNDTVTVRLPLHLGTLGPGIVRLSLPLAPIKKQLRQVYVLLFSSGLAAAVLAAGAGLLVSRRIVRPVETMTTMAERIASGDFNYRVDVATAGSDEIGRLGGALDTMQQSLKSSLNDIRHERNQAMAIVENMSDGVISLDGDGTVLFGNAAASRMLGLGEPLRGASDFASCHVPPMLATAVDDVVRTGGKQSVEFGEVTRGERIIRVSLSPIAPQDGVEKAGVVMVLRDMTETRRAQRLGKELVANASHELRTPIAVISSTADTLHGSLGESNERHREFLDIISRHAQRMGQLVTETLQLSQLDGGVPQGPWETVAVEDLVDETIGLYAPLADARGVVLDAAGGGKGDGIVKGVASLLLQVLGNLVDNAIRYTPSGAGVHIGWQTTDRVATLAVTDAGPGIPPAEQRKIFDRFVRGRQEKGRESEGTGLGLAIVSRVVELHGGTVELSSQPGAGSTFTVRLPATPADHDSVPDE